MLNVAVIKTETCESLVSLPRYCLSTCLLNFCSSLNFMIHTDLLYERNITCLQGLNKTQVSNICILLPLTLRYTLCTALCGHTFITGFQIKITVISTHQLQNITSFPVFLYQHMEILHCWELLYNGKMWTTVTECNHTCQQMFNKTASIVKNSTLFNFNVPTTMLTLHSESASRFLWLIYPILELHIVPHPPQSSWGCHLAAEVPLSLLHLTQNRIIKINRWNDVH